MLTVEHLQDHLPKYLTAKEQDELVAQLRDFENRNYYTSFAGEEILQGDGWSALELIRFETGQRDRVRGIVLSNSCDIDPINPRDVPPRLVFAPLVRLDAFINLLYQAGVSSTQIAQKAESIRKQRVTSLFYLPASSILDAEYMAILDDLHNLPLHSFLGTPERTRLFTLGQMGFYLFILKLSIHFCRFRDGTPR